MDRRIFLARTGALLWIGSGGEARGFRMQELDLVLKGGLLVDGSGAPARRADVGIRAGRIAALGELGSAKARRVADVSGLAVSPGFIDVHAHSEEELLVNPKAESKVRQGVTTEVLGMDGGSYEPETFSDELRELEANGVALNVASLVGQGTLRGLVMAMSDRAASAEEIERMRRLAASALRQGALGISSGLEYTPGGFATTAELADLCKVMSGTRGLYATHMRNEDDRVLESIEEAIAIAETASVALHLSHLKCQGRRNWSKVDQVFAAIESAGARGVSITMDRYPYVAYSTGLSNLMPLWSREGGTAAFLERLKSPEAWPSIRQAMEEKVALLGSWEQVMISSVALEKNRGLQGRTLAELAAATGQDPLSFTRELVIEEENQVGMLGFGMDEEGTARVLAHPRCMPASDGSALADYGELSAGSPHPRSYGTFARVLGKYVREMGIMPLEEAVRKMTSLPAERFGLTERGRIAEGFFADLAVFDPATVSDRATFSDPHRYAEGFHMVLVNGEILLEDAERTERLPGKVIRGSLAPRF